MRALRRPWLALALLAAAAASCHRRSGGPPYTPAESLATVRLDPALRIEAFVTEPAIASPVAMEFDERGRLFVVEMPGYPIDTRPTGRVKLLEDGDGDGRYEKAGVFADGLVLPTGVMRWRKGVIVTAAPDVWYLEDADDDGRAEARTRLLTGFAFTNPQHTVNGPLYGLDNWIHLAHEGPAEAIVYKDTFGDRGSGVRWADGPASAPLDANGHSVRFRPQTREIEAVAGRSQFGHAFDDWGRYFTLDNSNHVRHAPIPARYLRRNPDLLLPSAMQDVSDHGAAATVFPVTRGARFEMLSEPGQFTSACSLTFVPGGPLREALGRSSLVAEPVHNLVHRDLWSDAGATFVARRAEDRRELLAAGDAWFRPVNFAAGPDGALYLVDYYRPVIEHPEWGAAHRHDHDHASALFQGSDRGRIYRIGAAAGHPRPGKLPGAAGTAELVGMLGHPNLWWRRTAQRLLVERRPPDAPALLTALFRQSASPLGRLHALWTLEGAGALSPALVREALRDGEAGVRENAIVLAERFLAAESALEPALVAMTADPDPRVRFQLACTLGGLGSAAARHARERLLAAAMDDRWMHVAVLSASSDGAAATLERALAPAGLAAAEAPGRAAYLREAAGVVGARKRTAEVSRLVARVARAGRPAAAWWRGAVLEGLGRGLRRVRGAEAVPAEARVALVALAEDADAAIRRAALELLAQGGLPDAARARPALDRALARAADRARDAAVRADAIALAALAPRGLPLDRLQSWVDPREPEAVQAAAVRAMRAAEGEAAGTFLLARWRSLTPAVRAEAAEVLLADPARTRSLLAAIQDGRVQPWTLGFWSKRDLLMHDDEAVRAAAHALLEERPGEKEAVLKRYEAALDRPGEPGRGAQVFQAACARCHRFQGAGAEVGPDLGTVANRPASLLLKDILLPSLSIAQGYESYLVERVSGGTDEGVLAGQTPTTIVLRREGGQELVIPREDVRRLQVSQLSAMPSDLEQQVGEREMADLLAYLTRAR
jgi:putative membrane-bound dehydrogenase-like protein